MQALVELLLLAVAAWLLFRRRRVAAPPFDRALLVIVGALVVQGALAWGFAPLEGAAARAVVAGRALLLLAALAAWLSLVRAFPVPRWRWALLAAAPVLLTFGHAGFRVVGWGILAVAVAKADWPKEVGGWRRGLGLAIALPLAVATSLDPTGVGGLDAFELGLHLEGVARAPDLAHPLVQTIRLVLALFRIQLVVAFFRFLLLPVGLRTLPLERRFAVNETLTRSIPALLSAISLGAVVILAFGLHKASDARQEMERTLARAAAAAELLAVDAPFEAAVERARVALGEDASGAALIRRGTAEAAGVVDRSLPRAPFDDDAEGLLLVEGAYFLAARRGDAEAWIPLDAPWLARYSDRAFVDVELREMPGVKLGSITLSLGHPVEPRPPFAVRSPGFGVQPEGPGLARRSFPLSRLFLPLGNWRSAGFDERHGAVGLTVRASVRQAASALRRNPYLFVSNALPFLLLGALGLGIGLVEGLAVRAGRSIIRTVVDDVRELERGAQRIGSGDLDHRVPVPGKDELSRLAAALNTMAADLKRQQAALVEKERLEADLEAARSIQERLLPQGAPEVPGVDVAGVSLPSRVVGGDLFYFLPFGDGRLGLAVGDVSGKSLPAAFLMSNVIAVLRAEAQIGVEVDESLSRINRLLAEQIEPNRFVTLFYGIIDRRSDSLRYACAGHEPALIVRSDGTVAWLREGGTPLGILPDRVYRARTEPFSKGDVLVLYSDGLTEADSESGEFYGNERLAACVVRARERSATEILEVILASAREFTGGRPLSDDRTLVIVRGT